ncbi:hypothetical protein [Flavobacterium terrisoli]|uniref:hypothetical protein n=1 Tax=Flavobacterium terrisoli TaxID=3242195 RepID=UPI0025436BA7|nr:hypothetical protein [Flavobacterium buctense]
MGLYFLIEFSALLLLSALIYLIIVLRKMKKLDNNVKRLELLLSNSHENEKGNLKKASDILHDKLQGDLIATKNFIFIYDQLKDEKDKMDLLSNIDLTLDSSILNTRELSHKLTPPYLEKGDFIKAVEYYFDSIKKTTGKQFSVEVMADTYTLNENKAYELFRVIEMFCENVIDDQTATYLNLIIKENQIELRDDGNSFALNSGSEFYDRSIFLSLPSRLKILNYEIRQQIIEKGNHFVLKIINN